MKQLIIYKVIVIIFFGVNGIGLTAQNVVYTYDNHGNRTSRYVYELKVDSSDFSAIDTTYILQQDMNSKENTGFEIENQADNTVINIYPNPAKDYITINIISENNSYFEILLFNSAGQIIKNENTDKINTELNLSNLSQGIYILLIQSGNYKYQQKIIKQ